MNIEAMKAILEKIKEYDRIIIFRHTRPDGDAVGSTKGLAAILRLSFPEKEISVINNDYSDYISFLGPEEGPVPDEYYATALGIVIDTATTKRISNQKFALCRELIKIDHHIPVEDYGDLRWVEEERSSSCEMIAVFYDTFKDELKIDCEAATYVYTGMVTDSGRFRFREVSGNTLRAAAVLLDQGIDLDTLYAHLYMKDFAVLKFQAYLYERIKMTENGVVYLHVTRAIQKKFDLTFEEASAAVSYMDSIKNSLIWIAFIDGDPGEIRVRLRSRFVTVSELAEEYEGGGHACAAGATVHNRAQMQELITKADARLGEYKRTHEGWL